MSAVNLKYSVFFFLGLVQYAQCYDYSLAGLVISALFGFIFFCCMVVTLLALCLWRNWYHSFKAKRGYTRVPRIRKTKTFKQKSISETVLVEKNVGEQRFIMTAPSTMRSIRTVSTVPVRPIVTYPPSVISNRDASLPRKNQAGSWIVEIPDSRFQETNYDITIILASMCLSILTSVKTLDQPQYQAGTMNFDEEDNEPTKLRTTVISSDTVHPEINATQKQDFTSSHSLQGSNADDMEIIFDPVEDDNSVRRGPTMPLY